MPRKGIDWSQITGVQARVQALMEDTQPDLYVMLCNPADEEEVTRTLRTMGYPNMKVKTNPQVPAGSPMLQGRNADAPRTTGANVPDEKLDPAELAQRLTEAIGEEAQTYPDEKKMVWAKLDWAKLSKVEKTVLANAVQRLVSERHIVVGRVQ